MTDGFPATRGSFGLGVAIPECDDRKSDYPALRRFDVDFLSRSEAIDPLTTPATGLALARLNSKMH